jgi:beta-galactosidase
LTGDGRILGAGNGDPSYLGEDHPKEKDCKQFRIPAFNGLAQILVQSGTTASDMTLTVMSDGLKADHIIIGTK